MTYKFYQNTPKLRSYNRGFKRLLTGTKHTDIGIAVAYISVFGIEQLSRLLSQSQIKKVYLICDLHDCVTHPNALRFALNSGYNVRGVDHKSATFHPKLIITGRHLTSSEKGTSSKFMVGSNNLSKRAFYENFECSILVELKQSKSGPAEVFREFWTHGLAVDQKVIENYSTAFSFRNRQRSPSDISAFGVFEKQDGIAFGTETSTTTWVGLQSFTGEYTFQVEFPRNAGEVLQYLAARFIDGSKLFVSCDDGVSRELTFRYYENNSMFRLNIPNDVPGVSNARSNRSGVAVLSLSKTGENLSLSIVHQQESIEDIENRSQLFGTLKSTRTRNYGWY